MRIFENSYGLTPRERRLRGCRFMAWCLTAMLAGAGAYIAAPHAATGLIAIAEGAGYIVSAAAGE